MAIGRFIVVAYPFYARIALSTKRGFCAIISIHILSTVMTLPMLLHIRIRACRDASNLLMYQYRPRFQMPVKLYMLEYVKWVWPIIAVFIPLVVMTVINARLIRELSNAKKSRRRSCRGQVVRDKHQKITLTLVIIVLMFLVLVAPSEILRYVNPYKYWGKISYTIASVANVMQAVNFAFNFVLYCAVSASFRQTLSSLFFRRKQNPPGPETQTMLNRASESTRSSANNGRMSWRQMNGSLRKNCIAIDGDVTLETDVDDSQSTLPGRQSNQRCPQIIVVGSTENINAITPVWYGIMKYNKLRLIHLSYIFMIKDILLAH